jgi:hypothetical protein
MVMGWRKTVKDNENFRMDDREGEEGRYQKEKQGTKEERRRCARKAT